MCKDNVDVSKIKYAVISQHTESCADIAKCEAELEKAVEKLFGSPRAMKLVYTGKESETRIFELV